MNNDLIEERNKIIEDIEYLSNIVEDIEDPTEKNNVKLQIKNLKRYKDDLLKESRRIYVLEMRRNEEFLKVKNKVKNKIYKLSAFAILSYSLLLLILHIFSLTVINNINFTEELIRNERTLELFNKGEDFIIINDQIKIDDINMVVNNRLYYYSLIKREKEYVNVMIPEFVLRKMKEKYKIYDESNVIYVNRKTGFKLNREDIILYK